MPVRYCTECGQRLEQAVRYCDQCGAPIEALDEVQGAPSSPGVRQPGPGVAGTGAARPFRDEDVESEDTESEAEKPEEEKEAKPEEEKKEKPPIAYLIDAETLNTVIAYAFRNAPLDTEFLMLRDEKTGWIRTVPLDFIPSLQGLKMEGRAKVAVRIAGLSGFEWNPYSINLSGMITEEVLDAYISVHKHTGLQIIAIPEFDPAEWERIEKEKSKLIGKWRTYDFQFGGLAAKKEEKRTLSMVCMYARMPLSGLILKQNLREFEQWYSRACIPKDDKAKVEHDETVKSLQEAQKQIPDGFAKYVYLTVFFWDEGGGEWQSAILDEDEEEALAKRRKEEEEAKKKDEAKDADQDEDEEKPIAVARRSFKSLDMLSSAARPRQIKAARQMQSFAASGASLRKARPSILRKGMISRTSQ